MVSRYMASRDFENLDIETLHIVNREDLNTHYLYCDYFNGRNTSEWLLGVSNNWLDIYHLQQLILKEYKDYQNKNKPKNTINSSLNTIDYDTGKSYYQPKLNLEW